MILLEAVVLALLLSLATGGSLRNLEHERLRGEWVLLVLLPVQLVWPRVASLIGVGHDLSLMVWLVMMVALVGVMLANVWRRWILGFAALGIAMNVLVIGLNGAMPVSLRSTSELGAPRDEATASLDADQLHEALHGETLLPQLADVIAVPGPEWQRGVVSVGDILLSLGLAGWVFAASRRPSGLPG
ncbi:DUF5317 family protein [Anaerosoma tenue]|uniref:DUF5317 family protein n=1 Tax=Anaerosoma tenue TaxID=2933588 RepID=UPI002260F3FE|nr:DUF5317 family protein [Anaerosoma tenue]MCK8114568.1 DUF5317 domain-containing protein [Anaerosoma tenue]